MKQECNPGGSGGSNLRWVARNDSLPGQRGTVDVTISEIKNFKELQLCVAYHDGRILETPLIRRIEGSTIYQGSAYVWYDSGNYINVYYVLDATTGKITFYHYRNNGSVTTTFAGYFIAT